MWTIMAVVVVYFIISLGIGFWVARNEQNRPEDYFLAGRKLPWYAVSLSMTGSNIGTEHFVGMVGVAFLFGLAPATFEWGNFIPYSLLLWVFLPYFFRKKLYTVPEFLERRYNRRTRTTFAWLTLLYMVGGVLIPALYIGGRILYELPTGETVQDFNWYFVGCIAIIAAVTAAYCIYGGLLSVVWTDVLQVSVLVVGGLLLVIIGTYQVGGPAKLIEANTGTMVRPTGDGIERRSVESLEGSSEKDKFYSRTRLLLPADHPVSPWTGVATFWFTLSLCYVGTSQFYIQRCLGARSEWDAKMGVIGCAILKIFLPLIIVVPGLIAFAHAHPELQNPATDSVYIKMVQVILSPEKLGWFGAFAQGLLLAALIAAIMSTVSSVLNSTSTIWAIDIHQQLIDSSASESQLVSIGRWSTAITIVLAAIAAPWLIYWKEGIFIFIQSVFGVVAPSVVVVFLAAFFWSRAHGRSATFTLWFGILVGLLLWGVTSLPWMFQKVDLEDSGVQRRLAVVLGTELPSDSELRKQLDEDVAIGKRRQAIVESLSDDSDVQDRLTKDPALRLDLLDDQVIDQLCDARLDEFIRDPAAKKTVDRVLKNSAPDAAAGEQVVKNPALREARLGDPDVRAAISKESPFLERAFRDNEVRERIARNSLFLELLAKDPVVMEQLPEDAAARAQLAENEDLMNLLARDADVQRRLAECRAGSWLPFLGEGVVAHVVYWLGQTKPLLNRAAINWVICLIAMVFSTWILRADPSERYDPDAIWSFGWARLPVEEGDLNRFPRNLLFWWLVMVMASAALFVIFR